MPRDTKAEKTRAHLYAKQANYTNKSALKLAVFVVVVVSQLWSVVEF